MNLSLSAEEKNRYSRQLSLKGFGENAQLKLKNSSVLVVGAGGLGCPVLLYLAVAGVGKLGIIDGDIVSVSNLQRQVLFDQENIGEKKSEVAKKILFKKNPNVNIQSYSIFIAPENCLSILHDYDVIIDGSDNFNTRYLVNDACVILKKPLVYAALHEYEGQLSVFNYKKGPTLRCLFPKIPENGIINNCAETGVLGVLPGLIGIWQAQEAIKIITKIGEVLSGKLLVYHSLNNEVETISFKADENNKLINNLDHFKNAETEIDPITLKNWIANENIQLIDVRENDEFEEQNIGGLNVPLASLPYRLNEIDHQLKTVLICQSGKRSSFAFALIKKEYPDIAIYHLKYGLNGYLL
ncbi:MAG: HesA/MoeB/ThiF family protein [Pelobium sp.]